MDHGEAARHENRFVFECAWEVANKGLQTRAPLCNSHAAFSRRHIHGSAHQSAREHRGARRSIFYASVRDEFASQLFRDILGSAHTTKSKFASRLRCERESRSSEYPEIASSLFRCSSRTPRRSNIRSIRQVCSLSLQLASDAYSIKCNGAPTVAASDGRVGLPLYLRSLADRRLSKGCAF